MMTLEDLTPPGRLVGLTGATGAGKDSTAVLMVAHGYHAAAFADCLRLEIFDAWAADPMLFRHPAVKERPVGALAIGCCSHAPFIEHCRARGLDTLQPRSPRWVLQNWGEWRCEADPAYWVQPVANWIDAERTCGHRHLVVMDVRKPIELALLRAKGGHLLRVHRPGSGALAPDTAAHVSEGHAALQADGEIHNDGDFDHLHHEIARALRALDNPERTA